MKPKSFRALAGLALCWFSCAADSAFAQAGNTGSVFGQIVEAETGAALTNATVRVAASGLLARSGNDGRYVIQGLAAGRYALEYAQSGYELRKIAGVEVQAGEATRLDVTLALELFELPLYEVMADPLSGFSAELRLQRQESSLIMEAIGSEMFSRLAAGDAAEIVTKVTGVTVVEGKTAVVRGLSDRYNLTYLNGGEVPTADPYRKSPQLDMFPSETLESVIISKSFSPDLPGGFSGALINLVTKSFPEQFVFKASFGVGYNSQSTGNENYLTYPGGGLDALAMDDGTRALPSGLRGVTGAYLDTLARTATSGSLTIPLATKTAAALEMDQLLRSFATPYMGPTTEAPPPDHDFSVLIGDTLKIADRPLGYFAGISYERDYRFYENGIRARYSPVAALQPPEAGSYYSDTRSETKAQWSALANLAYRPSENHEVGFNFLYSQVAEDQARHQVGRINTSGENQFVPGSTRLTHLNSLHFTERNLTSFQFKGGHEFPALARLRLDWLAGFASAYQDEPDLRYLNLISDASGQLELNANYIPYPDSPVRYFRNLEDQNVNGKLDLTLPWDDGRALEWKLKTGVFTSQSQRTFEERTFSYLGGNNSVADPVSLPYNYMLGTNAPPPQLINFAPGRYRYEFARSLTSAYGNNFSEGEQSVDALYAMVEVPLIETLRLTGGVRYETTDLQVTSTGFQTTNIFLGVIEQGDPLPAIDLTWRFRDDMNLRASYSETVARPTYREFSRYTSFDPRGDQIVSGNPFLRMSSIQNFDLRWEWFTPGGGLLSLGGFYKLVDKPIEKVNGSLDEAGNVNYTGSDDLVTFENGGLATVYGVEFETRQGLEVVSTLLDPFSVGFNFAWIHSEIANPRRVQDDKLINTGRSEPTRALYDQSPYIINADISYDHERAGTSVSVIYNFAAERLALITNTYDVYEQGAPTLDLVISQRLGERFKVKFSAENLLNPEVTQSYAVAGPTDTTYVYSSHTRGITFGLSLSGDF